MGKLYDIRRARTMRNQKVGRLDRRRGIYTSYVMSVEQWRSEGYWTTLYVGYPYLPPCDPPRVDMGWFVSECGFYGVWVLNQSGSTDDNEAGQIGWSPFIRKSSKPAYEPLHIPDKKTRDALTWIVDDKGYGQYGMVLGDGTLWVPQPRPERWSEACSDEGIKYGG